MRVKLNYNESENTIEIVESGKLQGVLNERESGYQTVDFWKEQITFFNEEKVITPIIQFERFVPDRPYWTRVQKPVNYDNSQLKTDKTLYCTNTAFPIFPAFVSKDEAINEEGNYNVGYTNFYDWWDKCSVGIAIKEATLVGIENHNK